MRRTKFSLSVLLALMCACGTQLCAAQNAHPVYDDAEAYAVYSAILRGRSRDSGAKAKRLVIQGETVDYPSYGEKSCLEPAKDEEKIYGPVIAAYREINQKPKLLERKFDSTIQYEVVPEPMIDGFFAKGGGGWAAFYKKYPDSGGFVSMSAVGFNADKTIAIVYVAHSCGGLCGSGGYRFLHKTDGEWSEVEWKGLTCVWVS